MEIKKISEIDFVNRGNGNQGVRNTPQQGNLTEGYNEFIDFLTWTLESNHNNNSVNLKEAIKVFSEKYNMSMTLQFLTNQMNRSFPNKTIRVRNLLKQAGFTTIPQNRYFTSVINSKMILREFGTERSYSIGHTYRRLNQEQMDLLIDQKQHDEHMAKIKLNFEEMDIERSKKPTKLEAPKPELDYPGIEVSCKCGKTIKLPLTPNLETNKAEALVYGIYCSFINDVEAGRKVCSSCQIEIDKEGAWKNEMIMALLKEYKGSGMEFSIEEFCKEFRNDKKLVCGTTITNHLEGLMPLDYCKVSKDNIKLFVR